MMKRISRPFWNPSDRRPRALWRLLLYVLLLAATGMALSAFLENLLGVSLESALSDGGLISEGSLGRELGSMVFGALAIVLPTLFAARFFDRRPVSDLGLRFAVSWWRDLCFGLFLGALLMLLIFLVELALGWITIEKGFYNRLPYPFWVALFSPLTLFLLVGIYEELMVRGYIMKNLAEGLSIHPLGGRVGMLLALLLSSALFGLLHARNPNASTLSTFGLFLAGLLLGLPVLLTDELAIPIGLHITWNFFQGNVFGFPVSGTAVNRTTFIAVKQGGPDLWTGGAFGPEAGLLGFAAILVGVLLIVWWVRRTRGTAGFQLSLAEYSPRFQKASDGRIAT